MSLAIERTLVMNPTCLTVLASFNGIGAGWSDVRKATRAGPE
jgi:hypothetical protein